MTLANFEWLIHYGKENVVYDLKNFRLWTSNNTILYFIFNQTLEIKNTHIESNLLQNYKMKSIYPLSNLHSSKKLDMQHTNNYHDPIKLWLNSKYEANIVITLMTAYWPRNRIILHLATWVRITWGQTFSLNNYVIYRFCWK